MKSTARELITLAAFILPKHTLRGFDQPVQFFHFFFAAEPGISVDETMKKTMDDIHIGAGSETGRIGFQLHLPEKKLDLPSGENSSLVKRIDIKQHFLPGGMG
jgi:hypothetical protein